MKGTIVRCIQEIVENKLGKKVWEQVLENSGFPKSRLFLTGENVPDEKVIAIIENLSKISGLSVSQIFELFGEYWSTVYAPRVYKIFFEKLRSAREFILAMDAIHELIPDVISGAKPPRFSYNWKDENTLIMQYHSERGLIDLVPPLLKGVAKYFHEPLEVRKISSTEVEVIFR